MKRPSAYYLLLLYSVYICKSFLPVVSDLFAHALWESNHLATVHQHQGSHHLHAEWKKAVKEENKDSKANAESSADSITIHLLLHDAFCFPRMCAKRQDAALYVSHEAHGFLKKFTPPPKV